MRFRVPFIFAAAAIGLALALDRWAYDHVVFKQVYDEDWGRLLRVMGFWPTWGIAALALWLHQRRTAAHAARHALLLAMSPALAGGVAELLKLLLRRVRPEVNNGDYLFRAFTERPFSTSGLALPSSHTMVAFGAAAMLAYLFPRTRWVWFALAAGCGLTRVLAHAHFVSDVVVGAVAAVATTAWLVRRFARGATVSAAPESPRAA